MTLGCHSQAIVPGRSFCAGPGEHHRNVSCTFIGSPRKKAFPGMVSGIRSFSGGCAARAVSLRFTRIRPEKVYPGLLLSAPLYFCLSDSLLHGLCLALALLCKAARRFRTSSAPGCSILSPTLKAHLDSPDLQAQIGPSLLIEGRCEFNRRNLNLYQWYLRQDLAHRENSIFINVFPGPLPRGENSIFTNVIPGTFAPREELNLYQCYPRHFCPTTRTQSLSMFSPARVAPREELNIYQCYPRQHWPPREQLNLYQCYPGSTRPTAGTQSLSMLSLAVLAPSGRTQSMKRGDPCRGPAAVFRRAGYR